MFPLKTLLPTLRDWSSEYIIVVLFLDRIVFNVHVKLNTMYESHSHLHLFEVKRSTVHLDQLSQYFCPVVHGGHHYQSAAITAHQERIRRVEPTDV